MKIVILGSGNVAWHLARQLHKHRIDIVQIYSPNQQHAAALATEINSEPISDLTNMYQEADIYLLTIKDEAYKDIAFHFPIRDKFMVHTAGSLDLSVFQNLTKNRGVFYPFQTFTKNIEIDFSQIPICIEATDKLLENKLFSLAQTLSQNIHIINSEQRKYLHLSGVFACNFTNAMYEIAKEIIEKYNMDFSLLEPIIEETARKIQFLSPKEAQTGPAKRNDKNIMEAHKNLLTNEKQKQIYDLMSSMISDFSKKS